MTDVSGGSEFAAVKPSAPTFAVSFGANGSASQFVGVKLAAPSAPVLPLPTACTVVGAGSHEVGFVMNALSAPLLAASVRLIRLMCRDMPLRLSGMPLMVEVRPES